MLLKKKLKKKNKITKKKKYKKKQLFTDRQTDGQPKTIVRNLTISIKNEINKSINYVYIIKFLI